jgi:hypothetical protein
MTGADGSGVVNRWIEVKVCIFIKVCFSALCHFRHSGSTKGYALTAQSTTPLPGLETQQKQAPQPVLADERYRGPATGGRVAASLVAPLCLVALASPKAQAPPEPGQSALTRRAG